MSEELAFDSKLDESALKIDAADEAPPVWEPLRGERKSCRCKVPEARRNCELKVGANVLPALLWDESEHGFAVLLDRLNGLVPGRKAHLHTDTGWFAVRVVHVTKVARPKDAGIFDGGCDFCFRLGCSLLGKRPLPDQPCSSASSKSLIGRLCRSVILLKRQRTDGSVQAGDDFCKK